MKTFYRRAALSLALFPYLALAAEREHSAHEHGHVLLQIVQEGEDLHVVMQSPAANIIGFEHEAKTDADKATLASAVKLLKKSNAMFTLDPAGECEPEKVSIESTLLEHDEHDEHDHDEHDEHDEHDHDEHDEHDEHDHEEHDEHDEHDHEEHD
ncbi:MAG: DUF2796 domain-containing protein, partial [Pseudomonadota bacterium]